MDPRAQLINAYQQFLGRAPEAGVIDWRVSQLGGRSVAQQIADISNSGEAQSWRTSQQNSTNNALTDFASQSKAQLDALLERQKQEQSGLFDQYKQKMGSQEQLPALYQRLNTELGIPELSNQAQAFKTEIWRVKGLLDRLDENVTSRNLGTYTTQALRDRIVAKEGGNLRTELGRLGTGLEPVADMLTAAQGQVSTLLPLYAQQQDRELKPLEMQINSLSDRFAREITGFNSNKETTLTALVDKIQRERELSDREWELAQKLAAEEREFTRQKSIVAQQAASQYLPTQQSAPAGQSSPTRQLPGLLGGEAIAWLNSIQNTDMYRNGSYRNTPAYARFSAKYGAF